MPEQAQLRYLTYGHGWLILVDLTKHGYHHAEREHQTKQGPVGLGFVLVVPTADLDATWTRRDEGPGTAERIENSQVGVFLGYTGRDGRTLIDHGVDLPASWIDDRQVRG